MSCLVQRTAIPSLQQGRREKTNENYNPQVQCVERHTLPATAHTTFNLKEVEGTGLALAGLTGEKES